MMAPLGGPLMGKNLVQCLEIIVFWRIYDDAFVHDGGVRVRRYSLPPVQDFISGMTGTVEPHVRLHLCDCEEFAAED